MANMCRPSSEYTSLSTISLKDLRPNSGEEISNKEVKGYY